MLIFKELADKHIDIKDYCSTSIEELNIIKWQLSQGIQSLFSFLTILVSYPVIGSARSIMITPFLFYFPKVPADDFPAQRTAIDTAEIGLEVYQDKHSNKMPTIGWFIQQL
jgi:hypothetical protein